MHNFSIFICTRNRSCLLKENLTSLSQCKYFSITPIHIIDNGSTDKTFKTVEEIKKHFSNIHYHMESNVGIGFARNRCVTECSTKWIVMLDDDATVPTNFISQIIESPYIDEFDIIGGFFLPWYKYGRPKWYIDTWVSNVIPNFAGGPAPQGIYACAGIMAFKRDIWSDVKGFRIDLGHIGNKRLYGEETEFQIKAIQKGYKLAIDPKWTINHLVDQSKLKLIWQFSNGIKLGQAYQQVSSKAESTIRILSGLKHITLIYFPKIFISILLLKDPRTRLAFFLAETGFTSGVFLQRFFPFLL